MDYAIFAELNEPSRMSSEMTEPIIRTENLGKKYKIRRFEGLSNYVALRDVLANGLRSGFGLFNRKQSASTNDDEFWALKDVNFQVNEGEVVGIIGRNGAGKSTLLKVLSRITEPTSGRVVLNGRVASLLEVGTGFHPELTGRENIFLNGSILGMTRREIARKFDEIVAFASVEKFLDTPVKRYSSGMYVRLAFAVAAHLEPEILVVDEVLAVGDTEFQKKCLGKMGEVASSGRTVLFVTHQMQMLKKLCPRSLLFDRGQLLYDGPTEKALESYSQLIMQSIEQRSSDLRITATDGSATITGCEIAPADGFDTIRTGGGITITISAEFAWPLTDPGFVVSIGTLEGIEILHLSTRPVSGFDLGRVSGRIILALTIPSLPLVAGRYSVSLAITMPHVSWLTRLTPASTFDVEEADFYGSGFALSSSRGMIVTPHRWAIVPNPVTSECSVIC